MGCIVVVRRTQNMRRERTFQRRAKRLIEKEKGKGRVKGFKLQKGVWFFPSEDEARELVEIAKDCGLREGENILLFLGMKPEIASREIKREEIKSQKELEKEVQSFFHAGIEHQG